MNRVDLWRLQAVLQDRARGLAVLASPGGGWLVIRRRHRESTHAGR